MPSITLRPTQSTYVQQSYPTTNRNSEDRIRVCTVTKETWGLRGLLLFDLSSIPPHSIINSATLALYSYDDGSSYRVQTTFYVQRVTSSWSASSVTWNTQPSSTTAGRGTITDGEYNKWYSCNIKDIVQALVNGTTNYGVMLIQNPQVAKTSKAFKKSGDYRPKLTIDYTPIGCSVRSNGIWRKGMVYCRVNGTWRQGIVYARRDGVWRQGS